jgi:hypothetical protein
MATSNAAKKPAPAPAEPKPKSIAALELTKGAVDFPCLVKSTYLGSGEHLVTDAKKNSYGGVSLFRGDSSGFAFLEPDQYIEVLPVTYDLKSGIADLNASVNMRYRYANYIGADPEIFAVDGKGSVIPAFEYLGENTGKLTDQASAYWDGYQAEFSFVAPTCMDVLVTRIMGGLNIIRKAAKKVDKNARLSPYSTHEIPEQRRYEDPTHFVQFGCNPSLNIYEPPVPIRDGREVPFRSSGGHIHFTVTNKASIPNYIRAFDAVLGVVCVSLFQKYDNPARRTMYGRAGEHRLPKYGFEYRTLSSAWMLTPGLVQFVYEMARYLIGNVNHYKGKLPWWNVTEEEVRRCINECDVGLAHTILTRNKASLRRLLMAMPCSYANPISGADRFIEVIFNGAHTAVRDPENLSEDWNTGNGPTQCSSMMQNLVDTGYLDGYPSSSR